MKYVASLIVVESLEMSRNFYESVLGQKVKADYGENISFEAGFSIHLKRHFQKLIKNRPILEQSNQSELYFEEDDLQPVMEKIKELGMEILHPIKEQPWKQQVFRFYDYDKNLIEIGESMEHVAQRLSKEKYSLEEIARITYLELEEVKKALEEN